MHIYLTIHVPFSNNTDCFKYAVKIYLKVHNIKHYLLTLPRKHYLGLRGKGKRKVTNQYERTEIYSKLFGNILTDGSNIQL